MTYSLTFESHFRALMVSCFSLFFFFELIDETIYVEVIQRSVKLSAVHELAETCFESCSVVR